MGGGGGGLKQTCFNCFYKYQGARLGGGRSPANRRRRGAETAGRRGGEGAAGESGANPRGRERGAGAGERGANPHRAASRTSPNARPRESGANPNRPAIEHRTAQRSSTEPPSGGQTRTAERTRAAAPPSRPPSNLWVYRFSFRAREKGEQISPLPADRITDKSMCPRALNQTALGLHPCIALSSVG